MSWCGICGRHGHSVYQHKSRDCGKHVWGGWVRLGSTDVRQCTNPNCDKVEEKDADTRAVGGARARRARR